MSLASVTLQLVLAGRPDSVNVTVYDATNVTDTVCALVPTDTDPGAGVK